MKQLVGENLCNAIVSGANRGLGRAVVEALAKNHINVWAVVRHTTEEFEKDMERLAKAYDVTIKIIFADLKSEDSIKNAYKEICSEKRSIDILINNAAIGHMGLFQMAKTDFIKELYAVNVFAPMFFSQLVLRNMIRQKKGRIINVSSISATEIYEGNAIYGSSKAAISAFTQSLAAETYKYGITVNAIAPALLNTDMASIFEGKDPRGPIQHMALGRKIEPGEIADIVVNLLSDEMGIVNGQIITINGGRK